MFAEDQVVLAAPVKIEILSGSCGRDLPRLRRVHQAPPILVLSDSIWERIDG